MLGQMLRNAISMLAVFAAVNLISVEGWAADEIPNCPAYSLKSENGGDPGALQINNDEVLNWKSRTQNQFHARGHVRGELVKIYPDRNGHEHFSIRIGVTEAETIEVVYNQAFGAMPEPELGMSVEVCGDYITSTAPSPGPNGQTYPASPDGAIIHWIHGAPQRSGHHSGWLYMNGVLVGYRPNSSDGKNGNEDRQSKFRNSRKRNGQSSGAHFNR